MRGESFRRIIGKVTGREGAAPRPTAKEQEEKVTPFTIRGRHLDLYLYTTKMNIPPNLAAQLWANIYRDNLSSKDEKVSAQARDMIGPTERQAKLFEEKLRKLFERFSSLPDDYPIELVENKKDEMCTNSVTGEGRFCNPHTDYQSGAPELMSPDKEGVASFMKKAREQQQMSKLSVAYCAVEETEDAKRVPVVKINAGAFKQILRNWKH